MTHPTLKQKRSLITGIANTLHKAYTSMAPTYTGRVPLTKGELEILNAIKEDHGGNKNALYARHFMIKTALMRNIEVTSDTPGVDVVLTITLTEAQYGMVLTMIQDYGRAINGHTSPYGSAAATQPAPASAPTYGPLFA